MGEGFVHLVKHKGGIALKNAWEKLWGAVFFALFFAVMPCCAAAAESADDWYWLASDAKYSKYFAPKEVMVVKSLNVAGIEHAVPTVIHGRIKTGFSYEGAQETIDNYGIKDILPNPAALSYSIALVEVSPQNRTFRYLEEDFYDKQGNIIWSKHTPGSEKEMNSQQYDEMFYAAIVDSVFGMGELERLTSSARWLELWKAKLPNGGEESAIADTSTMRIKGELLFYWEWVTKKDAQGAMQEVQFLKKALNVPMGTVSTKDGKIWTPKTGWQSLEETDLMFRGIPQSSKEYPGLLRLRNYTAANLAWLYRASLEPNAERRILRDTD